MPNSGYVSMPMAARVGVAAACFIGGAAIGFTGTFAHQSIPPWGVTIALVTVAVYLVGLRVWGGTRAPALSGALGVGLMSVLLSNVIGGSVLVPANTTGYAWILGIGVLAFLVLAWPAVQRRVIPSTAPVR
jgi:hypothetical protein